MKPGGALSRTVYAFSLACSFIFALHPLQAGEEKSLSSSCDSVTITGKRFAVPLHWKGRKIALDSLSKPRDLVSIPSRWCHEGGRVYVTRPTMEAFVSMAEAAERDSVCLEVISGYRSNAYQQHIYERRMEEGQDFYDIARWIAPPGYSEHELGTAVDLAPNKPYFSETGTYRWLKANAQDFGFMESYSVDSAGGLPWEPWHWKYTR